MGESGSYPWSIIDIEIKDKRGVENGVGNHLSVIRVENDVHIEDYLPMENVYHADSTFVGHICLTSEEPSTETKHSLSIDALDNQQLNSSSNKITIDLQNDLARNPLDSESDFSWRKKFESRGACDRWKHLK